MQSIENKIVARIYGNGRGWAFSQIDFADLGGRSTIDWSLSRLEKRGTIRRLLRGIYYYPQESTLLKEQLPVEIPRVAQALARKFKWKVEPSGETALNILGVSNQVPSKYVYITNGRNKTYQIQKRELQFKKGMLRETSFKYQESAILVQALRAYGKENLNTENLNKFRNAIDLSKSAQILKDTRSVTGWVYQAIQKICAVEDEWKK
jgi:hypothetical protein